MQANPGSRDRHLMLAYAGRVLVPAGMSVSYSGTAFPDTSLEGVCGALLVFGLIAAAVALAGEKTRHWRLVALGIFWYCFDAGDYRTALDLVKQARRIDASAGTAKTLDQDIQTVEHMLKN